MPIVGGLDIHRKQITFDYLDTVTGEVSRGQIAPADPEAAAAVAGNEVGITSAHKSTPLLCSAHLCAGSTCGNTKAPWWRGCVCFPGGQGVAGSNPAVPTQVKGWFCARGTGFATWMGAHVRSHPLQRPSSKMCPARAAALARGYRQ